MAGLDEDVQSVEPDTDVTWVVLASDAAPAWRQTAGQATTWWRVT
jgi:hypothetical protein